MRDYLDWHKPYDDPNSRLSHRLRTVQSQLRAALDHHGAGARILSLCAGQGRDVIPVLAERGGTNTPALLVELDPRNLEIAEASARDARLEAMRVRCADASLTENYSDAVPADIVLVCGIFGNISDADIQRTVAHLPTLCAEGADVLWTRGRRRENDLTPQIRAWFAEAGFDEMAFEAPEDERLSFSVGRHRLIAPARPFAPGVRLFTFLR